MFLFLPSRSRLDDSILLFVLFVAHPLRILETAFGTVDALDMTSLLSTLTLVLVASSITYGLGYHPGAKAEEATWLASGSLEQWGAGVALVIHHIPHGSTITSVPGAHLNKVASPNPTPISELR